MQSQKFAHHIGEMVEILIFGKKIEAYLPPLLPLEPPVNIEKLTQKLERAAYAIGQLDGIYQTLPGASKFLNAYVRQEAVQSSQIENIPASLSDILLHEIECTPETSLNDVEEVLSYVTALSHGLAKMKDGFPLNQRLIRDMHEILLSTERGKNKAPGEYRRYQNWIGGPSPEYAKYVPPPVGCVSDLMGNLELFINNNHSDLPVLVQAGLLHVQFEMIHPFLDGNGRLGRLLITLLLWERDLLKEPLLYLSLFFNTHRPMYYAFLERVHTHGDWHSWLDFFLDGVIQTAGHATMTATRLLDLFGKDRDQIRRLPGLNKSALRVHLEFQKRPFLTSSLAANRAGISQATARTAIRHLENIGILREVTGRRSQVFVYGEYLEILTEQVMIGA